MTVDNHPGISEQRYQQEEGAKYQFRGYLPLMREDGSIGIFAVASGRDALGNEKTLVYEPPAIPEEVAGRVRDWCFSAVGW